MAETGTDEPAPRMAFEEVVDLFEQYDTLTRPYSHAAFLRGSIDYELDGERINTVEDGYLITHSGNRFRLADDQEFSALEASTEGAKIATAAKLGIEPELVDNLRRVANDVKQERHLQESMEHLGRDPKIPSYVTGSFLGFESMDHFLEGYSLLATLTGETFDVEVMENTVAIAPDELIEEVKGRLAGSFRQDRTLWRFQQWNQWAAARYEEAPERWPQGVSRQIDVSEIEQILEDYPPSAEAAAA